jgi:hypothetical protein
MNIFTSTLLPAIIVCIPAFILVAILNYRDFRFRKTGRRNPLTRDLLRSPGDSLQEKIDKLSFSIDLYLTQLMVAPLLLFSTYVSQAYFTNRASLTNVIIYVVIALGFFAYCAWKVFSLISLRTKYRVGFDAESAAGQELNQLMRSGFWVFHDFPADKFNIDHIVIGKSGVFAVETKGRSKPANPDMKSEVIFDGNKLTFPDWEERKPIDQAVRQAKWLEDWLSNSVGKKVNVQPVLTLPGWFITNRSKNGIAVINGRNCEAFFTANRSAELPESLLTRIAYQVEQRCRNVAPKAYKPT